MRFCLPTHTVLALSNQTRIGGLGQTSGNVDESRDEYDDYGGHGFAVGTPGHLGEYVTADWDEALEDLEEPWFGMDALDEVLEEPGRVSDPSRSSPHTEETRVFQSIQAMMARSGRPQGAVLAVQLVHDYRASPGGFFRGLPYRAGYLADYVGASNWLRARSRDMDLEWGEIGWTDRARRGRFQEAQKCLEEQFLGGVRSPVEAINRVSRCSAFERPELEQVFRAGAAAGIFQTHDVLVKNHPVAWEDVRATLLGMRLFTLEQVGMIAPWASTHTLVRSLERMAVSGFIEPYYAANLSFPIWKVTKRGVRDGMAQGILTEEEARYRTSIRKTQELHDLAVGDALILMSADLAVQGAELLEVQTETALLAQRKTGTFPDVVMIYEKQGIRKELPVEVVGTGDNYRSKAKQAQVAHAGHRMFSTGIDGYGCRMA